MSVYGVTTEGFRKKRLADIKLEIENTLKTGLGNNINLLSTSVLQNLNGVFAERESLLWELAEQVYQSQYLGSAEGVPLENVLELVSTQKLEEKKTLQRNLHLFGTVATVIPALTQVSVLGSPNSIFKTVADVTLVAGVNQVQTMSSAAGNPSSGSYRIKYQNEETSLLTYSSNAAAIQAAINALSKLDGVVVAGAWPTFTFTMAGYSGKINHELLQITSSDLNKVVSFAITTTGVPQGVVDAECTTFGAIVAPAYTLSVIDTPVVGLDSVTNPTDATVGRATETDNEARVRSKISQKSRGASTTEAIRAKLLEVDGVTQAVVFQNETFVVNADGLPGKSFRCYIQGGVNADLWQAVWDNKPVGIRPDGTEEGTVTDSQGLTQTVRFERPVVKDIYVTVRITKDIATFPVNGDALVRTAINDFINARNIGEDVIVYPRLIASMNEIEGINDIEIGVAFTAAPALGTDANLVIAINEIAKVANAATDIGVTVI